MKNKEIYINLCKNNPIPLFSQHYWLDAVCGQENWDVIIIIINGNVLASMPFYFQKKDEGIEIKKAALTQNNGIYFYYPKNLKYERKLAFEHEVTNLVIDELEKMNIVNFRQYFHYSYTNWLPFYWRGYKQTTRYTYLINDTSDLNGIISNFKASRRNQLKKAVEKVKIEELKDLNKFYSIVKYTYDKQNLEVPFSFNLLSRLYKTLLLKNQVKLYFAIDNMLNIHAVSMFVFDNDSVYYLISGIDPKFKDSQALTLLIFEGIKLAHNKKVKFDFEGSMKPHLEKVFRQFGGEQIPYFDITKEFNE